MTPIQAIRAFCLDCMCGQQAEVRRCPCQNCPLYPFRLGHNPNAKKREVTDAQRAALEKARLARKKLKSYNDSERESVTEGKDTGDEEFFNQLEEQVDLLEIEAPVFDLFEINDPNQDGGA